MLPNRNIENEEVVAGIGLFEPAVLPVHAARAAPLETAEIDTFDETVLAAAGIARPDLPPPVDHAAGVHNAVFGLEPA